MKIIQLTAGTGNFYCGTCLRDHALTEALRRLGHDTLLMPMYLPLVLEHEHETHKLVFGGINVYLQQKLPPFRVTPRWVDRLFDSSRLLRWASQRAGMTRSALKWASSLFLPQPWPAASSTRAKQQPPRPVGGHRSGAIVAAAGPLEGG